MTQIHQILKCLLCGNIIQVKHEGTGEITCCNKKMIFMQENTEDAAQEKHVPVIEIKDNRIKVFVGEIPHPMEKIHFIEWIEVRTGKSTYKKYYVRF